VQKKLCKKEGKRSSVPLFILRVNQNHRRQLHHNSTKSRGKNSQARIIFSENEKLRYRKELEKIPFGKQKTKFLENLKEMIIVPQHQLLLFLLYMFSFLLWNLFHNGAGFSENI